MKRFLCVVLSLIITIGCVPCLAADAVRSGEADKLSVSFSDVPADSWYAPYVDVCVAEGLMAGTGRGLFEPERALTDLECLVLALRLYDIQRGGDGALEALPEGWGQLTLTTADGKQITGKFGEKFDYDSFIRDGNADANLYFYLADSELDWGKSVGGKSATLAYSAKDSCTGTVRFWDPDNDGKNWALSFLPDDAEQRSVIRDIYTMSLFASTWWHSAVYTAWVWGLRGESTPQLARLAQSTEGSYTFRRSFALAISEAAGELEVVDPTAAPTRVADSDQDLPAITALYQAGILTGVDGTGDFAPYNTLTRAEAAAMLARVARPELRIGASLPSEITFVPFEENGLYGLKDSTEAVRIPAKYAYLVIEEDGFVVATDQQGNKGILNTDGTVVVPFLYPRLYNSPDEEGLVVAGSDGDNASPLHYNGKKGMINTQGMVVIPFKYDLLTPFQKGQASFLRSEENDFVFGHLLPDGTEVVLTAEEVAVEDPLYPALVLLGLIES